MNTEKNIYKIMIPLVIFFIISILSIYSATSSANLNQIVIKQIIWYLIGFIILIFTKNKNLKFLTDYAIIFYIAGNILLFLLLIFGTEINGSKCWFTIPGIGSFQPSEFMKIVLILMNAKTFEYFDDKYPKRTFKNDMVIFFSVMIITLVPSILTFLEPDTGMVIIYFLISFIMLFIYGIKKRIFLLIFILFGIFVGLFLYYYFNFQDDFIDIFGTSFFYRVDRILDWSNKSGMQLTNALAAIKAAGVFGFGIANTPIYIPEAHTDFIFSIYASNFGFIGTLLLIINIIIFDYFLMMISKNTKDKRLKYIAIGFVAMIIYQQIQNIGMNIGLLPITGITLPFISYGGSSLLSYMIGITLIVNYNKSIHNGGLTPSLVDEK